jgi:hypothetical protein
VFFFLKYDGDPLVVNWPFLSLVILRYADERKEESFSLGDPFHAYPVVLRDVSRK